MPTINELRDARKRAHNEAITFLAKEKFDAEARSGYDKAMSEVDRLAVEIRNTEANGNLVSAKFQMPDKDHKRAAAFGRWLRGINLEDNERRSLEFRDVAEGNLINHIGSYTGLGYLVPTGFSNAIEIATKYYAPLMDGTVFRLWETATGQPIPWPTNNDTAQSATIVGEAGNITEQDVTANQINFGAYKLTSGLIKASIELIQDSGFDLETFLADAFGVRYGRGLENYLTNGTGNGQPTGLLTAVAASGAVPTIAKGSSESSGGSETGANSIGYGDLVNLEHAVDPSYRRHGKYMFHDLT